MTSQSHGILRTCIVMLDETPVNSFRKHRVAALTSPIVLLFSTWLRHGSGHVSCDTKEVVFGDAAHMLV